MTTYNRYHIYNIVVLFESQVFNKNKITRLHKYSKSSLFDEEMNSVSPGLKPAPPMLRDPLLSHLVVYQR